MNTNIKICSKSEFKRWAKLNSSGGRILSWGMANIKVNLIRTKYGQWNVNLLTQWNILYCTSRLLKNYQSLVVEPIMVVVTHLMVVAIATKAEQIHINGYL